MNVTRTVRRDGATYDPPIASDRTTDLRGDALDFARLQWRAGLTSLDSGLDVDVIKCDHSAHGEGDQRYHVTIDGNVLDTGHFAHEPTWHQIVGIAIGARTAAGKAVRS